MACEVALDAAAYFLVGSPLGASFFGILVGFGVMGHFGDRDHVQGTVQGPVSAPVQSVSDRVPG